MDERRSEELYGFYCDWCFKDFKHLKAAGFCSDCNDFLCSRCCLTHLMPEPSLFQSLQYFLGVTKHYSYHGILQRRIKNHQIPKREQKYRVTAALHVDDIGVKMKDDTEEPTITGSVILSGNKLVTVDIDNCKVKLIDLQSNKVVSDLKHGTMIWDIAAVTNTQVAVTCPYDNTILFINVTNTLTLDLTVKVNGQCRGISCISSDFLENLVTTAWNMQQLRGLGRKQKIYDVLVITYCDPAKVEIINMTGELIQTVVTEEKGRQLFYSPWYVAVNPYQQAIYIADHSRDTVTCLDLSGRVKAIYEELRAPYGLAVDRAGKLYVCGFVSNDIHQLTPDLHRIQILLQKSDGIYHTRSVSYNAEQNQLYIGMCHNHIVQVYNLFQRNDSLKVLNNHVSIQERRATLAMHVDDIGVKMKNDTKYRSTYITGSVLLPGDKLVIVDCNNTTVKLVDLQSNIVVSYLKHDSGLWAIAAVTNTQVAVTCPAHETILFIKVTNKLTLHHKVKVNGRCHGIACMQDKLVITYKAPAKVEIISKTGKLLQTVVTEDRGKQLFINPWCVAISPDQQTIYISDSRSDTVTSLDLRGQVKATYKDDDLSAPRGLAVDRAGKLYVCGCESNNIHQLTPDLHKRQILLQESDGIKNPCSMSYNEEQNQLYIGMMYSDSVKVYQLHRALSYQTSLDDL